MTMAHDPTPPAVRLAPATIASVHAALATYIAIPETGGALRTALHALAAEARREAVLPEQLLVTLKDIWYSLPDVRAMKEQTDQVRLLQRVVTICIKEYYGV